jgi:Coenzyme PQQ synthesis protein D (PqqD)
MTTKRKGRRTINGRTPAHIADLGNLRIVNGSFVFDVCSGCFHRVSESAAYILAELKRRTPVTALVAAYAQRYGITAAIAERDVNLFLNDLSK